MIDWFRANENWFQNWASKAKGRLRFCGELLLGLIFEHHVFYDNCLNIFCFSESIILIIIAPLRICLRSLRISQPTLERI